jgi:hypothetical protein
MKSRNYSRGGRREENRTEENKYQEGNMRGKERVDRRSRSQRKEP